MPLHMYYGAIIADSKFMLVRHGIRALLNSFVYSRAIRSVFKNKMNRGVVFYYMGFNEESGRRT